MLYEIKFGLIGFVVGTVAISAATFASNRDTTSPTARLATHTPPAKVALLPSPKPTVAADKIAPAKAPKPAAPMSAWRRAYIAKHGHQPPVPAA